MADPQTLETQVRWMPCQNNSASTDIPGHALVRIVSVADDGTLTVDQPNADNQAVAIMSPLGAVAGGYGFCTFESPVLVLYHAADGTPSLDTYWGAKAANWEARLGYSGLRSLGIVAEGNGWALMRQLSDVVDASYTQRGLANLTTQFLGAGFKYIDGIYIGSSGSTTDYGTYSYSKNSGQPFHQWFVTIASAATAAAQLQYNTSTSLNVTNPNSDSSHLAFFTSGFVWANVAFATNGVAPIGATSVGMILGTDGPNTWTAGQIGTSGMQTGVAYWMTVTTAWGDSDPFTTSGDYSNLATVGSKVTIKVSWTQVPGAIGYKVWRAPWGTLFGTAHFIAEIDDPTVTEFDDNATVETVGAYSTPNVPTANQSGTQIGLDAVCNATDSVIYSGGIIIARKGTGSPAITGVSPGEGINVTTDPMKPQKPTVSVKPAIKGLLANKAG